MDNYIGNQRYISKEGIIIPSNHDINLLQKKKKVYPTAQRVNQSNESAW